MATDANNLTMDEDADMAECDGQPVVTMVDVLKEQQEFEEDANAVLGASDDKNCTYTKGYVKRQAIYACLTCCSDAQFDPTKRAGVCLACSLNCHENHELVELYTKRNFRCDCGNPKFCGHPCQFTPNKNELNEDNKYNQNFSGLYCNCHRPYPDPESSIEEEMIQCIVCEDWLHASHLDATVPSNDQYAEMICKTCMDNNTFLHDYSCFAVNAGDEEVNIGIEISTSEKKENSEICNGNLTMDITKRNDVADISFTEETIRKVNNFAPEPEAEISNDEPVDKMDVISTGETAKDISTGDDRIDKINVGSTTESLLKNKLEQVSSDNQNIIESDVVKNSIDSETIDKNVKINSENESVESENILDKLSESSILLKSDSAHDKTDNVEMESEQALEIPHNTDLNLLNTDRVTEPETNVENIDSHVVEVNATEAKEHTLDANLDAINETETEKQSDNTMKEKEIVISEPVEDEILSNKINLTDNTQPDDSKNTPDEKSFLLNDDLENLTDTTNEINAKVPNTDAVEENTVEKSIPDVESKNSEISKQENLLENDTERKQDQSQMPVESMKMSTEIFNSKQDSEENKSFVPDANISSELENNEKSTTDVETNTNVNTSVPYDEVIDNQTINEVDNNDSDGNFVQVITKQNSNTATKLVIEDNAPAAIDIVTPVITEINSISDNVELEQSEPIKEQKRKLPAEEFETQSSNKKLKTGHIEKTCCRPKEVKRTFKGATFWPSNFRQKLCTCNECIVMYKELAVLFLIDPDDTVTAYEALGLTNADGNPSQYEKGLQALSSLDRIQQINALTEYNKMRDKLLDFLKSFKDKKEIVKEEDIKTFFAGMKPRKEVDGVYFCQ